MPYLIPRSQSVILDAGGNGTVRFAIDGMAKQWVVGPVTVRTNQAPNATPIPSCGFYLNQIEEGFFEGGTSSGNQDTATGAVVMYPDDILYAVFLGGIPGSMGTVRIKGTFALTDADVQ